MKKRIKILSSTVALASIGVSTATSVTLINSSTLNKNLSITNDSSTRNDDKSALVPAQANGQNANISTNAGPITFNNNVITALDWYGNKLWDIDMKTKVPEPTSKYNGSFKRAWFNWDYNRKTNILWVLGYGYNSDQSIFGIDADTGNFKYEFNLGHVGTTGSNSPYKFVTALSSGKVLIYGGATADYNATGCLYDPTTNTKQMISGNSKDYLPLNQEKISKNTYRWYFYNLIPLANGINLAEIVTFDSKTQTGSTGDGSAQYASYNVYGLLVDDNLNFIGNTQSEGSVFKTAFRLADGMPGYRNTTITPQRDYFTLLNSQTVSVTYNTVTLFNTSNINDIKVTKVKMTDTNWIQTWTIDSNDNLYFKFLADGKVYKIDGDTLKSGKDGFSPITYLDLASVTSNSKVKEDAKNFLIYNVYGYTGQLMMIDASYYNQINIYDKQNQLDTSKNWGLAIAVVPNASNNKDGDFKGVLNGTDSIQSAADFTINSDSLKTKIPSEITKQDIQLLNNAFFKDSDTKPFIIYDINDTNGTFKITANLYKIPWFADKLPDNAVPNVVSYTFGSGSSDKPKADEIKNKVSWKKLDSSSNYDFMNMKPSNVKVEDLNALDPFQPSFQSQKIYDSKGNLLYPKTTYSCSNANDEDGTIKVNVKYEYVPMSVTFTNGVEEKKYQFGKDQIPEKQVLTYESSNTYKIFSKSSGSAFYFMGSDQQSTDSNMQTVDVRQVPQLKNLLSAGKLPSSFASLNNSGDTNNSQFLQFVNTSLSKGYPISKMNFNLQPDDSKGTLTITATMSSQYSPDNNNHTYSVQYTNLNNNNEYKFDFKDSVTSVGNESIKTILPSTIDEGDIIKNFITYEGFDSNDFSVDLTPNDEQGSLTVKINLNKNYASTIANANNFVDYSITKVFNGFMTTADYNSRFSLTFKGDDDTDLLDLKNMQASQIENSFTGDKAEGLTLNGVKYKTLNEFIEKVLVKDKGTSIPEDWSSDSNIKSSIYIDNNLGVASFYVNIPKASVQGSSSDLNFMVTYTGFVKGNVNPTNDNLSFVSDKMLKNYLVSKCGMTAEQVKNLTPKTFADWAGQHVDNLITYKTGEYVTKLADNGYKLTITPNEIQRTVSVTINFGSMKDSLSLSEYTIQYTI